MPNALGPVSLLDNIVPIISPALISSAAFKKEFSSHLSKKINSLKIICSVSNSSFRFSFKDGKKEGFEIFISLNELDFK